MRRPWYGRDTELSIRMFVVLFLLAALYLGFLVVLAWAGMDAVSLAVIGALMLGVQYFFADKLVLLSMGAREVSPAEAPELHALMERLAALADTPKPRLAVVRHQMPNAFATGRSPSASVVAVTTGLLETLEPAEVEAVLAHELSHVRNRDALVMTLASFFAVVAQFVLRAGLWGGFGYGRRRRDAGGLAMVYLASLLVWVLSFFLIRALSRYREYAADRGAAILTGAPSRLAAALLKISGNIQRIPQRDLREVESLNAFFIMPAIGSAWLELLATHPPVEKRVARLMEMARRMEESP